MPSLLRPAQAGGKIVESGKRAALEIATEADAPYPSVYIEPASGKWDLSAFDGVEMDVRFTTNWRRCRTHEFRDVGHRSRLPTHKATVS